VRSSFANTSVPAERGAVGSHRESRSKLADRTTETCPSIHSLRGLRNRAVHTNDRISENDALGYADLALAIARH
jgi:hypothetical protein